MPWLPPALALVVALLTAWASGPVLRRLPEPGADPADADLAAKPPYRSLATLRLAFGVAVASAVSGAVAFLTSPPDAWLAWTALTVPAALAVAVDLRTTWLPSPLVRASWAVAAVGAAVAAVVRHDPAVLAWAAASALGLWLFFHLVWRFTGGIGYGDVRLAATIGAVTGAVDPRLVLPAAFLGTVAGALWGIVRRVRRGTDAPFAYGPALWSGPFWAAVLLTLTPG